MKSYHKGEKFGNKYLEIEIDYINGEGYLIKIIQQKYRGKNFLRLSYAADCATCYEQFRPQIKNKVIECFVSSSCIFVQKNTSPFLHNLHNVNRFNNIEFDSQIYPTFIYNENLGFRGDADACNEKKILYTRGDDINKDNLLIKIPKSGFGQLVQAILEYNLVRQQQEILDNIIIHKKNGM